MRQKVIIAGAGISVAPPSNLPSWWEYNKKLIAGIKTEVLELCPEAKDVLKGLDVENKLPVQCISQIIVSQGASESYFPLLELLNGTCPNANHFALAELARLGLIKAIVTTNFDTLIETAFQNEAVPLFTAVQKQDYYESAQITACKLYKIHGSVHDYTSLIDTVRQKAIGLSPEKRFILENILSNSDIYVIGFSGADLDFDLDYIPLVRAIESGSKITWVVRSNNQLNPNVEELQKRYPHNVCVKEMELRELFEKWGAHYREVKKPLLDTTCSEYEVKLTQRIKELFSSDHIGKHGCVGYCLTLLDMIDAVEDANKLAEIYEKKLDVNALKISSVLGINAFARQKLLSKDWQGALRGYNAVIKCLQHFINLCREIRETKDVQFSAEQFRLAEQENAQNLAAAYTNIGNVYYY
ncbi:MAG: SIR2 family protein, partial [Clostridia bacterium]|nr:SIR2 family protein [Clostridia bacterium]